jgi:hypothetical protein
MKGLAKEKYLAYAFVLEIKEKESLGTPFIVYSPPNY